MSKNLVSTKNMMKCYQRSKSNGKSSDEVDGVVRETSSPLGFDCGNSDCNNKIGTRPQLFYVLLFSVLSCCLFLASHLLNSASGFSFLYTVQIRDERLVPEDDVNSSICSSVPFGTICCDRSSIRSDICIMKGDVRADSVSSSVTLYRTNSVSDYLSGLDEVDDQGNEVFQHEKIRPYTRKWEAGVMDTIQELNLFVKNGHGRDSRSCDVQHHVPALFFSAGGYTGNAYHDMNDGILPLFITSQRFKKKAVFVILEFRHWWFTKYADVLSQLSDYPVIDFRRENKTIHCFPEAIVGLKIHDELTVAPELMDGGKTIRDFRNLLDRAYWPRISGLIKEEEKHSQAQAEVKKTAAPLSNEEEPKTKPKLLIISRKRSREITNEDSLVELAEEIGFSVKVLVPDQTTELAKMYRDLNSTDVMVGVHGAAMTYFLFMRPGSVFIQIVPIGTDWPSESFYGEPARKLGLKYVGYKVLTKESSLYDDYSQDDPVLTDPDTINKKGWEYTKKIYLDRQNVKLNLPRFRKRLVRAYDYITKKKNKNKNNDDNN